MVWTEAYNALDPQYPPRSLGGIEPLFELHSALDM
jgi:hypothetical protein